MRKCFHGCYMIYICVVRWKYEKNEKKRMNEKKEYEKKNKQRK